MEILEQNYFYPKIGGHVFTPKFGEKNAGTRSFQDCVIKESIAEGSISVDSDVVLGSALFG